MAYHTLDDLTAALSEDVVVQLTDDSGAGVVDTVHTDEAATAAQNLIDGYLKSRYAVPLSTVPGVIREISLALAVYHLYGRRTREKMPTAVREDRENAIRLLGHIGEGKLDLFAADRTADYRTNKELSDRMFPDATLDAF